ncbi:amino acid-binding protein [Shewanella sp. JM162201]|uniref:Glycine cleavage system transcriptional repressor n=1 Tax=Shewanella jiangmenensis TaxID=2837387 RepID=A0ABS5V3G7_9GAMM|nr:ACT domain-containing protein [Shewanella jiangmenensis]MBT1445000.1 amino acid-binding protein [Shewanella jiangmenensis]
MLRYLITLQAPDRTGLVEQIAHAVSRHGGNWLDSELRHIDGIFAAILVLEIPSTNWDDLLDNLECIDGLTLTHASTQAAKAPSFKRSYSLVAYDRPGLVLDISNKINALGINIEHFSSQLESASHTGVPLFRANFVLGLEELGKITLLTESLYLIGDDVQLDQIADPA